MLAWPAAAKEQFRAQLAAAQSENDKELQDRRMLNSHGTRTMFFTVTKNMKLG